MYGKTATIILLAAWLAAGTGQSQTMPSDKSSVHADSAGYITVLCRNQAAAVYIDSSLAVSCSSITKVNKGMHRVCAYHPDRSLWIKPQFVKDIVVQPGDTVEVRVVLSGVLWLDTQPTGAEVFVDGVHVGVTPMQVMLNGPSALELKKEGYLNRLIQIEPGKESVMLCTLTPGFQVHEVPGFSRTYVYSAAVLSFAANVCGYLFKRAADTEYDRYSSSSAPEAMNSHFSKTKKYDDMSAVCYGIAQVSLGTALFMVIRNMGDN